MKLSKSSWRQIAGDMDPGTYGGTIARWDDEGIEILEIQPVRAYTGDSEALEVGCPFWSTGSYHDPSDLALVRLDVQSALTSRGLDELPSDPSDLAMCVAEACHDYGIRREESDAGFARDVIGDRRVKWWASRGFQGWRFLADEDRAFKQLMKEHK